MFSKKFNVVAFVISVVVVLFLTSSIVTGVETTKFNTDFMDGDFVGNVELKVDSESSLCSYVDSQHGITYNISTVDDTDSLIKIYKSYGIGDPTKVTLNGNDWNVYFTDAMPNGENKKSDLMNIVICQSQGAKQGYLIYVIVDSESDYIGPSMDTSSNVYTQFVKPLLESITLKETNNVPKIYEEYGLSEDEFYEQVDRLN